MSHDKTLRPGSPGPGQWLLEALRKPCSLSAFFLALPSFRHQLLFSGSPFSMLEKEMPTPLNLHTWKIPWAEEPGGLQSVGSQRVEHDGMT